MKTKLLEKLNNIFSVAADYIYPPQCIACGKILKRDHKNALCNICNTQWNTAKNSLRETLCGVPSIPMTIDGVDIMRSGVISSLTEYRTNSLEPYFEVQRRIIFSLKRNEYKSLINFVRDEMCALIQEVLCDFVRDPNTVITSMPRNRKNMIKIGVDNMKTVGKGIADSLNIEYVGGLAQKRGVKEQKTLNSKNRELNMKNNIYILKECLDKFKNKRVILVDDVITTGSGIRAAATELINKGKAKQILVFSITMNSSNLLKRV